MRLPWAMDSKDQTAFMFDKVRKPRARKAKPVPEAIAVPEGHDEPWLYDPRSYFCPTVVGTDASVAGYVLPDPGGRPEDLFRPRELRDVPKLAGNYSLTGAKPKIYLPVDNRREDEMLAAGAAKGAKGGFFVDMDHPMFPLHLQRLQAFTPFIAKPLARAFQVEPIPSTSWGATLANLLTATSWERLRLRATHPHAHLCQICGEGGRKTIDVHELWTYEMPKRQWDNGIQRLVGLLSVCRRCHRIFHPGFAHIMGKGEEALARMSQVNRWSRPETDAYMTWAGGVWAARSKVPWAIDLSFIDGEQLVVSSSAWTHLDDGRLQPRDASKSATRILGAKWSMTAPRGRGKAA